MNRFSASLICLAFVLSLPVCAADTTAAAQAPSQAPNGDGSTGAPAPASVAQSAPVAIQKPKKMKGGNRSREKDADGTEALHAFKANPVIQSHYKLNGKPLEVDPD